MALQQLDTVNWGERMAIARKRRGYKLRDVADAVGKVMPTSFTSIARLEDLDEMPEERRRRGVAYCALLVYGFDPHSFGLTDDDVPEVLQLKGARDLLMQSSPWITAGAAPPPLADVA
jgi:transcriptional regulator with XRE-family HTH domain